MYGKLPSYQAMFQREGVHGPADLAIVGSAEQVKEEIVGLAEAGVTSFAASEYCLTPQERTDTRQTLLKLIGDV